MKNLTFLKSDADFKDKIKVFVNNHYINETKAIINNYKLSIANNQSFPLSNHFNNVWTKLKSTYFEIQNGRCCICEKELNDIYSQDIEHYRPKNHYWWLAYNPQNYYLSCAECNRSYKKIKFPLFDEFPLQVSQDKTSYINRKNINNEKPLLLNPVEDNPDDYFELVFIIHSSTNNGIAILQSKNGISVTLKERADKTIEIYNLDLHSYSTDSDKSRFNLMNKYYNDLFEIAKARVTMNKKNDFIQFLTKKLNERQELKTLDLLKLIIRNQVIINTLTN